MKLACESCHARYSVADERVAGKVLRFRCKKCSHVIVLRGAGFVDDPLPPPSDVWHAIVDGTQVGPFDRDALLARAFADATYVWREGMPDWAALGTIDELRVQPPAAAAVHPPPAEASSPAADAMRLRNERNETSVLFTLGNLQRLAAAPVATPAAKATAPREEGSGLIDIGALASTWGQPATPGASPGSIDDLPVFAPSGIADPIVLVPQRQRVEDRRVVFALIAMLAMVAAVGVVLVFALARDGKPARAAATPVEVAASPRQVAAPPQVELPMRPPRAVPVANAVPASAPVATAEPVTKPEPTTTARKPPRKVAAVAPPARRDEATCSEVSCMVSSYAGNCCDPYRPKAAPTTAGSDLPEQLDRAALAQGIATIPAQRCGTSSSAKGDVTVSVKVTAAGTVSTVTVKHSPDPALAACVTAAAKQGSFAKTKRGGSFAYFWRF